MISLLASADFSTASLHTPWEWCVAIFSIVWIDIVLAGDNAVVIALAVRTLPPKERLLGIALGSGLAVVLRVGLTYMASQLLAINYIKLIGGVLILWIAVKLLVDNTGDKVHGREAGGLWQAVWLILVADITMSVDNVLAVAGASQENFGLMLFGLGLSIPLVVFTSNLLSKLMDRYKAILYVGSAILGQVGGKMILTDHFLEKWLQPTPLVVYGAEIFCAVGVIVVPLVWRKRNKAVK